MIFHKNSSNASSSRDTKSAAAFRDELYYNKSNKNNEGMPSIISNNWGSSGIGETFLETVLDTVHE